MVLKLLMIIKKPKKMKQYLYRVININSGSETIKVSNDFKEVYRDLMSSSVFNVKTIDSTLKTKNVSKKEFYKIILNIDPLQAYRFVDHISTNKGLLTKNRFDFGISLKTWNAFKKVDQSLV
jgi:uncharacterized protein (UPF0335 family)